MKKLVSIIIMLIYGVTGLAQGLCSISGQVSDSLIGSPVQDHPVIIRSDSLQGFYYYHVVYTDSAGYYSDLLQLGQDTILFYVETADCNGVMHTALFYYSPFNSSFVHDFQICTAPPGCHAMFVFMPDPAGSADAFFFTDMSEGLNLYRNWDFGDGSFSNEINPYHQFSGPGIYRICLTVGNNNCTDTYCAEIIISDTVYYQIYGQVFAGNFPSGQGEVRIFSGNPAGTFELYAEPCRLDSNGIYFFTTVTAGMYYLQAVPDDSTGFLPTYFGNNPLWEYAIPVEPQLTLGPLNIQLMSIPPSAAFEGPGSLSGNISNMGLQRMNPVDVNVLLANENLEILGYTVLASDGSFHFPSLDYGVYNLRPEYAGVWTGYWRFEITPEQPDLEVNLVYFENSIIGIQEADPGENVRLFPNPASDIINIKLELNDPSCMMFSLYSLTGEILISEQMDFGKDAGQHSISLAGIPTGIYTGRLIGHGISYTCKIIKK